MLLILAIWLIGLVILLPNRAPVARIAWATEWMDNKDTGLFRNAGELGVVVWDATGIGLLSPDGQTVWHNPDYPFVRRWHFWANQNFGVALYDRAGRLILMDAATGERVTELDLDQTHQSHMYSAISFSPAGKYLAIGTFRDCVIVNRDFVVERRLAPDPTLGRPDAPAINDAGQVLLSLEIRDGNNSAMSYTMRETETGLLPVSYQGQPLNAFFVRIRVLDNGKFAAVDGINNVIYLFDGNGAVIFSSPVGGHGYFEAWGNYCGSGINNVQPSFVSVLDGNTAELHKLPLPPTLGLAKLQYIAPDGTAYVCGEYRYEHGPGLWLDNWMDQAGYLNYPAKRPLMLDSLIYSSRMRLLIMHLDGQTTQLRLPDNIGGQYAFAFDVIPGGFVASENINRFETDEDGRHLSDERLVKIEVPGL